MSELQAAIEFQVELSKFYNVDLFQRGFYQIRCQLKTAVKTPAKIEVNLPRNSECNLSFPASIINGVAVSKTFQILYRNEDVSINDVILFKVHMLVDSHRIEQSIEEADFQLAVELWFTDEELGSKKVISPDLEEKLQCISQRTLRLHFSTINGLHHHVPVLFDYFHLSVVCVTIHASLLALHQAYIYLPKQPVKAAWSGKGGQDQATLETVLFGNNSGPTMVNQQQISPRLQQACRVHRAICSILLSAYESLQSSLEHLMIHLPSQQRIQIEHRDCYRKLETLAEIAQSFQDEEDLLQAAQSDVAQLCAENVILWSQYIEIVTLVERVTFQLAREHHNLRVKRFAEVFFTYEYPKSEILACYDPSVHSHNDLANVVRSSEYFTSIPVLPVECAETDGDVTSTPIVFEDIFCDARPAQKFTTSSLDEPDTTDMESSVIDRTQNTRNSLLSQDSTRSDNSSSVSGDSTSPKFKHSKKRNFIKNIRPEVFKRPSLNNPDVEANVAYDKTACTLVGFRKVNNEDAPVFELGTLSPENSLNLGGTGPLFNALSMPVLVPKPVESKMVISGSMPELCHSVSNLATDTPDLVAMVTAKLAPTPIVSHGSDSNLAQDKNTECIPIRDRASTVSGTGMATDSRDNKSVSPPTSSSSSCVYVNGIENGYVPSSPSETSKTTESSESEVIPNQRPGTTDFNVVANVLSEALGEPEIKRNNSIKSAVTDSDSAVDVSSDQQTGKPLQCKSKPAVLDTDNANLTQNTKYMRAECTILELLQEDGDDEGPSLLQQVVQGSATQVSGTDRDSGRGSSDNSAASGQLSLLQSSSSSSSRLVSPVTEKTISFIHAKENLRRRLLYQGHIYSDYPSQVSQVPYFWPPEHPIGEAGVHLVICVHGLDGNSADLRLVRTYLEMALPGGRIDFLMSERNQPDTFADFEQMTTRLVKEILDHMDIYGLNPTRISFVGHSLGNLIIRSALACPEMALLLPKLHTFLSLSGPHLGTLYNTSGLVNMGMWFMQKWKKSGSLLQLSLKDHVNPRESFIYKLSQKPGMEFFRNVLLVSSMQDRYVPYHSSRIELCKAAVRDNSMSGSVYCEMVTNILQPLVFRSDITVVRYDVFHALPSNANTMIGRAAHIAVLDSEIFIEKFLTVAALKYFK